MSKYPEFKIQDVVNFWDGDIRSFEFRNESFDYLIHGATDASTQINKENPILMWDTIVLGTKRILDFAAHSKIKKILMISSGAVDEVSNMYDMDLISAYAIGKKTAEQLLLLYRDFYGLEVKIARCYAFVGPYLPLEKHFAVGNFILNAIQKEPICIKGDGRDIRSYLYGSDLMIWLWTILINGKSGHIYNVGSDQEITIMELAKKINQLTGQQGNIHVLGNNLLHQINHRYVPNIDKSKSDLNLRVFIGLKEALEKTIKWHHIQSTRR